MDDSQKKAVKKCMPTLINELDVGTIILKLRALSVLTSDDLEIIQSKTTASESRLEFMNIIQRRDNAWEKLLKALVENGQRYLGMQMNNNFI